MWLVGRGRPGFGDQAPAAVGVCICATFARYVADHILIATAVEAWHCHGSLGLSSPVAKWDIRATVPGKLECLHLRPGSGILCVGGMESGSSVEADGDVESGRDQVARE